MAFSPKGQVDKSNTIHQNETNLDPLKKFPIFVYYFNI